jgi:hypothetical protein
MLVTQPVDTGIRTRKGNPIMSERDETILNADDTEGHVVIRGQGEGDDTEGHVVIRGQGEGDDTEGHVVIRGQDEDDDTEGHLRYH